jgi:hypothetical protein
MGQMKPLNNTSLYFSKSHLIITLSSHTFSSSLFPSWLFTNTLYELFLSNMCQNVPVISSFFTLSSDYLQAKKKLYSSFLLLFHSFFLPNIFPGALFRNPTSPHSSFNIGDQFSHPYKTTGGSYSVVCLEFYAFMEQTTR